MTARSDKIGLGTAQWGLEYGVANRTGRTPGDEVGRILARAKAANIQLIDTAALYGEAEAVLGVQDLSGMSIVTKTPRFGRGQITAADADELIVTFERSLFRMRLPSVYGLLAHHADDLLAPGGERLIEAMFALRERGSVARVGASVYDGGQIAALLDLFTPDIVQLPLSVFDRRLVADGSLARLKSRGVEIHARSAFLQGLLLMPQESIPAYFRPWGEILNAWHSACAKSGVLPQHAALAIVCDQREIDCCVVGVQSRAQIDELLAGLDDTPAIDLAAFACSDPALLNPANWNLR